MNNKDEYIIKDDGESYTYTKNSKLHREEGPAYFSYDNSNKSKYLNLADKHLYKFLHVQPRRRELLFESEIERMKYRMWKAEEIHYFLEGKEYSKDEFEKIKASRDLKNELSKELTTTTSHTKKTKL